MRRWATAWTSHTHKTENRRRFICSKRIAHVRRTLTHITTTKHKFTIDIPVWERKWYDGGYYYQPDTTKILTFLTLYLLYGSLYRSVCASVNGQVHTDDAERNPNWILIVCCWAHTRERNERIREQNINLIKLLCTQHSTHKHKFANCKREQNASNAL